VWLMLVDAHGSTSPRTSASMRSPLTWSWSSGRTTRRLKMAFPEKNKCILVGKAADRLGVVGGRDELTAGLESCPKSQHKVPNFGQRQIVVGSSRSKQRP